MPKDDNFHLEYGRGVESTINEESSICAKRLTALIGIFLISCILGVTSYFIYSQQTSKTIFLEPEIEIIEELMPELDLELEPGDGVFENAAVSCDSPYCAQIGSDILEKGGSVADAAIATLLCMGVVHPQSMGIGGGFLMVLYNATTQQSIVLNARETAPHAATVDMFQGDMHKSTKGGLAVGVPGEIAGYWKLHEYAGSLPWSDLFEPAINLCENGFKLSRHAAMALKSKSHLILEEPSLAEIFVNPDTGDVFQEGDNVTRKDLTETLRLIAKGGAEEFYEGELAKRIVEDLQEFGGIITMFDMQNYSAEWQFPIKETVYGGYTLHSVPPPGSGILVAFIMKLLGKYQFNIDALNSENIEEAITNYHRIIEAFKFAFAKRTELGDPILREGHHVYEIIGDMMSDEYIDEVFSKIKDWSTNSTAEYYGAEYYQPDDHGTGHVSILAPNGDAISATSTVNLYFGAMIRSKRTGIIYNDQMDDFASPNITNYFGVPPSKNNFIAPRKHPLSSMTPTIFTDPKGKVKLVIGTAGGTKITTATALVSMRNLWFGENITTAINTPRLHHQLFPMVLQYEVGFPQGIIAGLKYIGHNATEVRLGQSICVAIARECDGKIYVNSDFRKNGTVSGF